MNKSYYGDLETKMKTGTQMAKQHNAYAYKVYQEYDQIVQRYDLYQVQRSILNAHKKFYGMQSKYDGKGNLVGGS